MTTISCEAGQFKKFLELIKTLHTECRIHLSEDKLICGVVDTGNIGMVHVTLETSELKNYEFNPKCPKTVCVDVRKLSKALVSAKANTPLTVEFTKDRVKVSYDEIQTCLHYMLDADVRKDPNLPAGLLTTCTFAFDGSLLTKFAPLATDSIKISVKDKIANIRVHNTDEDDLKSTMLLSMNAKGDGESIYSWIDLINPIRKLMNKTYVSVKFATDYPIQFEFNLLGISVKYLVAPRIEEK